MRDPLAHELMSWPGPRPVCGTVAAHHDPGSGQYPAASLDESVTGIQKRSEKKPSIRFNTEVLGETPQARLSVNREDEEYHVTYPMAKLDRQDEVQNAVSGIQQRYAEQAVRSAESGEDYDIHPHPQKKSGALFAEQVAELLAYQEALEIATTLDDAMAYDENDVKRQRQFRDKLNDWYTDGLRMIRDELRNHSSGLAFVRGLLRSGKEVQIDIGIRLAREESIRPALQAELVRVFLNAALPAQLRQRAFSYLRTEVRRDPGGGSAHGS